MNTITEIFERNFEAWANTFAEPYKAELYRLLDEIGVTFRNEDEDEDPPTLYDNARTLFNWVLPYWIKGKLQRYTPRLDTLISGKLYNEIELRVWEWLRASGYEVEEPYYTVNYADFDEILLRS